MDKVIIDLFHEAKIQRRDTEKKRLKWTEEAHAFWEGQYAEHGDEFSRQMMDAMFDLRASQTNILSHISRHSTIISPAAHLRFPPPFRA